MESPLPADPFTMSQAADALEQLVRTDGWKIFLGYIRVQRDLQIRTIEGVVDLDTGKILRASGALAMTRELATWPEKQAKALRVQIQQKSDKETKDHARR